MNKGFLKNINFATVIFAIGALISIGYIVTLFLPVTDEAFVSQDSASLSSPIVGYAKEIYIENGQNVKKDQPLLLIGQEKYKLDVEATKAQYDQSKIGVEVVQKRVEISIANLNAAQELLKKMKYEYEQKSASDVANGVPMLELKTLQYNIESQENIVKGLQKQIELVKAELEQAKTATIALDVVNKKAQIDLNDTVLKAPADGYVTNMFLTAGASVVPHIGLFQFVNTENTFIQANMNEGDTAKIKSGDEVLIFPRAYLFSKVFHGVVMSDNWSVDKVHMLPLEKNQIIINQNHWLSLPQRLPVQIKVLDNNDSNYPLHSGMSAFIYVKTKR